MRERLKGLWQQARGPASTGITRLGSLARALGRWIARGGAAAGRWLGRGLAATFSWNGGFLAARWILLLAMVAGLGFFLGRARPELLPVMPWETGYSEQLVQGPALTPVVPEAAGRDLPGETGSDRLNSPAQEALPAVAAVEGAPGGLPVATAPPEAAPAAGEPAAAGRTSLPAVDLSSIAAPVRGDLGQTFAWVRESASRAWRLHDGVDLITEPRQPVTAALSGQVVRVARSTGGGISVWVDHGGGWTTRYESLSESFVVEGQQVAQGQAVGRAGRLEDGTSAGVHFAVYHQGRPEDPLRLLPLGTP